MNIRRAGDTVIIHSDIPLITDGQSALDLIASIYYEHGCSAAVMNKEAVAEDFFRLSTGLAGEAAQKFVNYHFRLALTGDFSMYESRPLQDFMRESNQGRHLYFCRDEQEALRKLGT